MYLALRYMRWLRAQNQKPMVLYFAVVYVLPNAIIAQFFSPWGAIIGLVWMLSFGLCMYVEETYENRLHKTKYMLIYLDEVLS